MVDEETPTPELNLIEQAQAERAAIEKVNEEMKANLARYEKIRSDEILSGRTFAGKPQETHKETPVEYRQRIDREIREGRFLKK
jgi:hypothetical protein